MKRYFLYILDYPYEDSSDSKERPVVVLDEQTNEVFMITKSNIHPGKYYKIKNWKQAGLSLPCYINLSRKLKVNPNDLGRSIGKLSNNDINSIIL